VTPVLDCENSILHFRQHDKVLEANGKAVYEEAINVRLVR
jgi:hypothetical protein